MKSPANPRVHANLLFAMAGVLLVLSIILVFMRSTVGYPLIAVAIALIAVAAATKTKAAKGPPHAG
ncbi:hypothetical protein [Glacieibacterium frigidum]|uniref:Uncharacterized protein n=1 Tax=Glacieibacterium frigidum TaxID=2593303 RepID=A0A552UI39_9SPHN|nr:hypothetical protein [Glacieibacterium frigidum]TRW17882.1 hypothetical protein FMM06_07080 [Glacieibacterium frigidum]